MRGRSGLLLLALCLLLPAALAAPLVHQGSTPNAGAPAVPQLYCEIVYETAGAQRCDVFGRVRDAGELRIVVAGPAGGHAYALVDDLARTPVKQIGSLDCSGQCRLAFPPVTTDRIAIYLYTSGGAQTSITAAMSTALN